MANFFILTIQLFTLSISMTITATSTTDREVCIQEINTERTKIDMTLSSLTLDSKLQTAATTQTTLAVHKNCSTLKCPGEQSSLGDLVTSVEYNWKNVGQLVAAGPKECSGAVKLWVGSESNKKVLLDNFIHVGCSKLSCPTCVLPFYYTCIFAIPAE